jgi:3-hydroxyisobutyrate dehydrogenase-like beta-hydroxyacid dehydrogenase
VAIKTVGLLSPGDMGHSVGSVLRESGLSVMTCLAGRSERTRALAARAGIQDTPSLDELVREVDVLLCILVPSEAVAVAEQVSSAIRAADGDPPSASDLALSEANGRRLLYVDCNAIAPQTARAAGRLIVEAGGRFADAGIIGSPPTWNSSPRFYASGPGAVEFAQLAEHGLDVRVIEGDVGRASGLKMCYGALTKGLQALGTELLVAARALGVEAGLESEQRGTLAEVRGYLEQSVPIMPPKAHRWVGEMDEIALCFEELGLTPRMLQGAADLYRFVAQSPIGQESPESRDLGRDLDGVVAELAQALEQVAAGH